MENKKFANVLLVIMGVLIVATIVAFIPKVQADPIRSILYMISLGYTALYGFWLYKKPHGNMLKIALLLFAVLTIIVGCINLTVKGEPICQMIKIFASTAVCYCAGRLNRIDQNKYIMPVIGLAFLGTSVYFAIMYSDGSFLGIIPHFRSPINYITLMIAYFARYEEHKLAGLIDAPKN